MRDPVELELPWGVGKLNPGLLQEQQVFLTTESSLQLPNRAIIKLFDLPGHLFTKFTFTLNNDIFV